MEKGSDQSDKTSDLKRSVRVKEKKSGASSASESADGSVVGTPTKGQQSSSGARLAKKTKTKRKLASTESASTEASALPVGGKKTRTAKDKTSGAAHARTFSETSSESGSEAS